MNATANAFTPWWLAWGAAFLAIEIAAIRTRKTTPGGTLSSLVWRFSAHGNRVRRGLLIIGWGVLTAHFFLHVP